MYTFLFTNIPHIYSYLKNSDIFDCFFEVIFRKTEFLEFVKSMKKGPRDIGLLFNKPLNVNNKFFKHF